MKNRYRPYNKSLLINVFINNDYKFACDDWCTPDYDNINNLRGGWTPLMHACWNNGVINIIRLLLSHPKIDMSVRNIHRFAILDIILNMLKSRNNISFWLSDRGFTIIKRIRQLEEEKIKLRKFNN